MCECHVDQGGGDVLPTELNHLTRKEAAENKRLASRHLATLGVSLRYPTYREGLTALAAHHRDPSA